MLPYVGGRDFANGIKVKDLEMQTLAWIIQWVQSNHKGP